MNIFKETAKRWTAAKPRYWKKVQMIFGALSVASGVILGAQMTGMISLTDWWRDAWELVFIIGAVTTAMSQLTVKDPVPGAPSEIKTEKE